MNAFCWEQSVVKQYPAISHNKLISGSATTLFKKSLIFGHLASLSKVTGIWQILFISGLWSSVFHVFRFGPPSYNQDTQCDLEIGTDFKIQKGIFKQ
jgi:hypothetical protein